MPADDMGESPRPMPRPTPQRLPLRPMQATGGQPDASVPLKPLPRPRPGLNVGNLGQMLRPGQGGQGMAGQLRPMPRPGMQPMPVRPGAGAMNPQIQAQALGDAFNEVAGGGRLPVKPMQSGGQFSQQLGGIQPNKPYYR